jgi:RND family efflux transporter MFP subunit
VAVNRDALSHVNPRVAGLVIRIHVALGQTVQEGDPLCELDSVELGRAVADYLAQRASLQTTEQILARERELLDGDVALAEQVFERERDLAEQQITTLGSRYEAERALQETRLERDARILELQARASRERIALVAAERELELMGLSHEAVDELEQAADEPHAPLGSTLIRAPRSGVVVARDVTVNQFVDPATRLFEIQDLAHIWVLASVYEQDLAAVRLGAPAVVRLDAFPGVALPGEVGFIDYHVEPGTRAAAVRIELENAPIEAWPEPFPIRPGMYGRAEIRTDTREASVVVPESALVHGPGGEHVFVETAPGRFERRALRLGVVSPSQAEVLEGLAAGETVAAGGTFQLESALRTGELGGGHGH